MRRTLIAGLSVFAPFALTSCAKEEPKAPPPRTVVAARTVEDGCSDPTHIADFSFDGSMGMGPAEVHLGADGRMTVRLGMRGMNPPSTEVGEFTLSEEEMEGFAEIVRTVNFFDEEKPSQMATCSGESRLRVALDGRSRESRWILKPSLDPLARWFHEWIRQVTLSSRMGTVEGVRELERSVDPRERPLRRPEAFREPLLAWIEKRTGDAALTGLAALARIEAPGPWAAIASRRIAAMKAKDRLLFALYLAQDERATQAHRDGLLPDLLAVVREEAKGWDALDSNRAYQCCRVVEILADRGDRALLVAMPEMARESPQAPWKMLPVGVLARYGERGLDAVLTLLSAPEPRARRAAAYGLQPFHYDYKAEPGRRLPGAEERARVRERLDREVLPRLAAMAADPAEDRGVRDMAKDTKITLERGLGKVPTLGKAGVR